MKNFLLFVGLILISVFLESLDIPLSDMRWLMLGGAVGIIIYLLLEVKTNQQLLKKPEIDCRFEKELRLYSGKSKLERVFKFKKDIMPFIGLSINNYKLSHGSKSKTDEVEFFSGQIEHVIWEQKYGEFICKVDSEEIKGKQEDAFKRIYELENLGWGEPFGIDDGYLAYEYDKWKQEKLNEK